MAKKEYHLTPRGTAIYPHLNAPDFKFKKEGEFKSKLAFDAKDPNVPAFRKLLEDARDAKFQEEYDRLVAEKKLARAKELKKDDVLKAEVDEETGEETGRLIVSVSMKHNITGKDGKTYKLTPTYYSGKGETLKNPPRIGGGSTLRCQVELYAYLNDTSKTVGVSLRLASVQIIKLVSGGSRSAADAGFEVEDDADDIYDVEDTGGDNDADTGTPGADDDL